MNPEEEAIEILTSENVSLGGPRGLNISFKQQHPDSGQQQLLLLGQEQVGLDNNNSSTRYLTVTGTVKRGRNKACAAAAGFLIDFLLRRVQNTWLYARVGVCKHIC